LVAGKILDKGTHGWVFSGTHGTNIRTGKMGVARGARVTEVGKRKNFTGRGGKQRKG